jgi:hypothetical protein
LINLDPALAKWATGTPWEPQRAKEVADRVAKLAGLAVLWEPGDEEWILLSDGDHYQGMISVTYPLALVTAPVAEAVRKVDSTAEVVEITGFLDENLSASPELLERTALPDGWDDDFDPSAFCANDLFVESV